MLRLETDAEASEPGNGVMVDPAEGLHLSVEASAATHHRGGEMWSTAETIMDDPRVSTIDRQRRLLETRSKMSIMSTSKTVSRDVGVDSLESPATVLLTLDQTYQRPP